MVREGPGAILEFAVTLDRARDQDIAVNYTTSGAVIDDAMAVGTIVNSDPLPNAWLSRFGRTASDQVVQSIGRRLEGGARESHVTVMGFRADSLFESSAPVRATRPRPDCGTWSWAVPSTTTTPRTPARWAA